MAVDGEDGYAVVSTVGGEEKFAAGMDFDFGCIVAPGETFWNCRNRIQLLQHSAAAIVRKCGDAGLQFIDYVSELVVGMKGEVARSGPGVKLGIGRIVRGQGSGFCVEAVHE